MRSSAIGSPRPLSARRHALVAPAVSGLRAQTARGKPRSIRSRAQAHERIVRGKRFVLIASQFNQPITRSLVRGALETLRGAGASDRQIKILWVPGAFELPVVAARIAAARPRPDAIIALGAILRGETSQYKVLAHAVAQGLSQVAVTAVVPVSFGVIVAETAAQARARAGGRMGNRGAEAAHAALAVLSLFRRMNHAPRTR